MSDSTAANQSDLWMITPGSRGRYGRAGASILPVAASNPTPCFICLLIASSNGKSGERPETQERGGDVVVGQMFHYDGKIGTAIPQKADITVLGKDTGAEFRSSREIGPRVGLVTAPGP